jgi:chromate transporter
LALGLALLRLGAFAFGGMGSTLALLRSDLGARRGWITDQDVAEALAITQTLPGSTGVQVVAFLEYRVAGLAGALLSTVAVFLIPILLAGAAAGLAARLRSAKWFAGFGTYAAAAAIGLLGLTLYALAKPVFVIHPGLLLGSALVFIAAWRDISPLALIAGAIVLGAIGGALWGSG